MFNIRVGLYFVKCYLGGRKEQCWKTEKTTSTLNIKMYSPSIQTYIC